MAPSDGGSAGPRPARVLDGTVPLDGATWHQTWGSNRAVGRERPWQWQATGYWQAASDDPDGTEPTDPESGPEAAWRMRPDAGPVDSQPAATDGRAFVTTADGDLVAVAPGSGDVVWTTTLDAAYVTDPVVTSGIVAVGTESGVRVYSTADGEQRWTASTAPVTALVAAGAIYAGTDDAVLGLRSATGTQKWRTEAPGVVTGLAVEGSEVYAADGRTVLALDVQSGRQKWSVETSRRADGLAVGTAVVATGRNGIVALDPDSGDERWRRDIRVDAATVAVAADRVFVCTGDGPRALAVSDGSDLWSRDLAATTPPVVVGETVYVGTDQGVDALDARDGEVRFSHGSSELQSPPVIVDGTLYAGTEAGDLTAVTGIPAPESPDPGAPRQTDERSAVGAATDDELSEGTDDETASLSSAAGSSGGDQQDGLPAFASQFEAACDPVDDLTVVDDTGPVHSYDCVFTDDHGTDEARIYALAPDHAEDDPVADSFLGRARQWSGISKNTHVATVFDFGDEPRPWVAFERGEGRLDTHLGELDRDDRIDVLLELSEGVRTGSMYNVSHRGIDPTVVFITDDDLHGRTATLADWGLRRAVVSAVDEPPVTSYTSPEQLADEAGSGEIDTYRLGALAYALLTGQEPFADAAELGAAIEDGDLEPPSEVDSTLSAGIDEAVQRAMAVDPDDRFGSPYDLKQRLGAARK